jgi:hypothetical protein
MINHQKTMRFTGGEEEEKKGGGGGSKSFKSKIEFKAFESR